jgi:hypothetical protein
LSNLAHLEVFGDRPDPGITHVRGNVLAMRGFYAGPDPVAELKLPSSFS